MSRIPLIVIALAILSGLSGGCHRMFTNQSYAIDVKPNETGELAAVEETYVYDTLTALGAQADVNVRHTVEVYPNGRLQRESWKSDTVEDVTLTFHENGRLKSEERYVGQTLRFGVYYDPEGHLIKTVGERLTEAQAQMLAECAKFR